MEQYSRNQSYKIIKYQVDIMLDLAQNSPSIDKAKIPTPAITVEKHNIYLV